MIIYDFIIYDVWGNEEDGWEVNGAYRCGIIEAPPDATDTQILSRVYDDETLALVEIDPAGCDDTLYIRVRESHRPLGELRPRR